MNVVKISTSLLSRSTRNRLSLAVVLLLLSQAVLGLLPVSSKVALAATLPAGFQDTIVFSGLTNPTVFQFAPDGRVFVGEKGGKIKVFSSLSATTPTVFADLSTNVDDYWDRGLLGLALDPGFPTNPYIYALYTYDAPIGGTAPVWNDGCPTPPGATTDGCVVSGRLSRLQASPDGNTMVGSEQVLINGWCQQFPSHSIGTVAFGPDGALYAGGGDGANFNNVDYGQYGGSLAGTPTQVNPCGDPPGGVGVALSPPTAEGGALRTQSLQRSPGDPVVLNGTVIRVDPATGQALPTNPLYGSADANARRIIASGLRNPFRFTMRPGTSEIWIGDVGWSTWEEVDRVDSPTATPPRNFGWPCYEGSPIQSGYQSANLAICSNLYNTPGSVTAPLYAYNHSSAVVTGDGCPTANGSSITGVAFYTGSNYPSSYNGALFFADHTRNCIWAMGADSSGTPNPSNLSLLVGAASHPVDLKTDPVSGDLFYADMEGGAIHRITYTRQNQAPVASFTATPTNGPAPLTVQFDASASYDPDTGDRITYDWDLNGDGVFGDSSLVNPSYTYSAPGNYTVRLRVTDNHGATSNVASQVISANNTPPTPVITAPASTLTWKVGDTINFSGSATDAQDGTLPASALSWSLVIHHCPTSPTNCHTHQVQTFTGVSSGSFSAPDHDYPSYLELILTATDSGGLQSSTSVQLNPQTVNLTLQSSPTGLQISAADTTAATTFVKTVIVNSQNTLNALSPQVSGGLDYRFGTWSDGGAQSHGITAGSAAVTYLATFTQVPTLLGSSTVQPNRDSTPGGRAMAFRYAAQASGSATNLNLFLDGSNSATSVKFGIYSESNGNPGVLLSQGTLTAPHNGAWNSVALSPASITAGTNYWIAVLDPPGNGTVRFRDGSASGARAQLSAQNSLSALPQTWQPGRNLSNLTLSVNVDNP